MAASN